MIPTTLMTHSFKRAWKTADIAGMAGRRTEIALQAALEHLYPQHATMIDAVQSQPAWHGGAIMLFGRAGEGKTTELARAAVATPDPLILLNAPAGFREHLAATPLDELPAGARLFGGIELLHDVHEALDSEPGKKHRYVFVDAADMVATPLYAFQSLDALAQKRGVTIFATGRLSREHVPGNLLPVAGVDAAEVRVHGFACIIGGRS